MKSKKRLIFSTSKNQMSASMIQRCTILKKGVCALLILTLLLSSCVVTTGPLEPQITYYPNSSILEKFPSSFPSLSPDELQTEWGKELYLGLKFAREFDLYRALTCYKRSLFLAP